MGMIKWILKEINQDTVVMLKMLNLTTLIRIFINI
jgi:hypothetical protein